MYGMVCLNPGNVVFSITDIVIVIVHLNISLTAHMHPTKQTKLWNLVILGYFIQGKFTFAKQIFCELL